MARPVMNKEMLLEIAHNLQTRAYLDKKIGDKMLDFNMGAFATDSKELRHEYEQYAGYAPPETENHCGTSCCIAGMILAYHDEDAFLSEMKEESGTAASRAAELAGLTSLQAEALFYGDTDETDPEKGACAILRLIDGKDPWNNER